MIMTLEQEQQEQAEKTVKNVFDLYNNASSRSVPGSRRNSNDQFLLENSDGKSLLNHDSSYYDDPIDFLGATTVPPLQPPRSFSVDVGTVHHSNYTSNSLFFDDDSTPYHSYLRTSTSNYISQPSANSSTHSSSTSSYGLFPNTVSPLSTTTTNEIEASLRKNSARSVESLRSKSWAQFIDTPPTNSTYYPSIAPLDSTQQAFYSNTNARRFSHGWIQPPSQQRITTSYSYSDLHMAATLGSYRLNECQQMKQYGYCRSKETCPYTHPILKYSNSTSTVDDRKSLNGEDKFSGLTLLDFKDRLYELCMDQHGCRFLQLKLEESLMNVDMIYNEIHLHFVELMMDPFGNYLCQKLLEKCNDEQRSKIVNVITPEFLSICLSMHGTRAVQKLIEFLSTKKQIQQVIVALQPNVVALIKDLNGNHVIQKCLHRLSPEHNQFIYDTVAVSCIQVASHKHGCCVYQRCIDHASPSQKIQLVNVITQNALPLVQDPFGNYVVQYVLELGDATFSDNLIRMFIEPIRELSVQKFSSNVIEKCIRVAEKDTRRLLISGIINHPNMDRFLRDSYANYVIQTCLDFAEQDQRNEFIDCIKPLLPSIRNTPYGKRIYSKIHYQNTTKRSAARMLDLSHLSLNDDVYT